VDSDPGEANQSADPEHWQKRPKVFDKLGIKINAKTKVFANCVRIRIATADPDLGEANQSANPEHWLKRTNVFR
jgi:hypothetical protein